MEGKKNTVRPNGTDSAKGFYIFVMEMFQPARKIHVTKIQRERVIVHHVLIQKMWHML
ncbi:hypothetical protein [Blautia faecis]|uniref:hypothetical protein n=1 Tax=Blautia faecis TaxID=871665 RepID=UPI00210F05E4|nr:hypothetical protein [Blautia faecis]MCQ4934412.1 hypothetical protein [Blautia faecis]